MGALTNIHTKKYIFLRVDDENEPLKVVLLALEAMVTATVG